MSGAREPPSERAALMANQTAKEVAEQLCGKKQNCKCQRAQGPSAALVERRKVRDVLMAKPLPELRKFARELRDRYAKLLEDAKKKPTLLSVPWNQYEGWLRDLDGRLQASLEEERNGQESEAKRQLVLLYFEVQVDLEQLSKEIDLPVDDLEFLLGSAVNTVTMVAKGAADAATEIGRVARNFVEGSETTSVGDRLLPTVSTGTKVVLGVAAGAWLLSELAPLLSQDQ